MISKTSKKKKIIGIIVLGIVLLLTIPFVYWVPKTCNVERYADFDNDGKLERYSLRYGRLKCFEGDKIFWEFSGKQIVQDFEIEDIDGDGKPNLILQLVNFKDFGRHIPFWHKKRNKGIFSHIYIYDYRGGFREFWCSSALIRPAVSLEVVKIREQRAKGLIGNKNIKRSGGTFVGLKIKDRQCLFAPAIKDIISGRDLYRENIWIWEDWGLVVY